MKRSSARKGVERRKKPRSSKSKRPAPKAISQTEGAEFRRQLMERNADICQNCSKDLKKAERALFVEEEVGRIFCSEGCISEYFAREIARLEKEYFRQMPNDDLSGEEREQLNHLRWVTLQEPDEVWREKLPTGDYRHVLISEFRPGETRVWCVCICLFLKGEPSFLFMAFPTQSQSLVNYYRRGEKIPWTKPAETPADAAGEEVQPIEVQPSDRLADPWTEDETFLAQTNMQRTEDDIPPGEFGEYQRFLQPTLETPDEVWTYDVGAKPKNERSPDGETESSAESPAEYPAEYDEELGPKSRVHHFIKCFTEEKPSFWYIIVARETEQDEEQMVVLDAFPTRDGALVDSYRKGEQAIGVAETRPTSRVVH